MLRHPNKFLSAKIALQNLTQKPEPQVMLPYGLQNLKILGQIVNRN
jgi:hypothetical protein